MFSSRGNRIVNMVPKKDQAMLERLKFKPPLWETTKGLNLEQVDINELKNVFCDKQDNNNVIIQSCVIIRPAELDAAKVCNSAVLNDQLLTTESKASSVTTLQKFLSFNSTDSHHSSSIEELTVDSGSEYVPSPVCSSLDSELEFSDNSNPDICEKSKKWDQFHKHEQVKESKMNLIEKRNQSERNKTLTAFNERGEVKFSNTNLNGKLKRDKKEHCVYCEQNVTNFSRHLIRKHDKEIEVVKIMSLPKNLKKRKFLFDEIRKRGNFINSYGKEGFINPVRRPRAWCQKNASDYLPCSACKGFFTRTFLHRHMKNCSKNSQGVDSKHAQANGLTLLHMSGDNNFEDLKIKVFPRMQSDDITKTVMNDFLIKFYGERYYKCHKEKHLINTVSQRMRELARFLITLQGGKPKLCQLIDYLKPSHFDQLINATNEMSGYNSDKDTFKSPSLALRWATVLKQVCDTAMFLAAKESDTVKHKEIKTLRQMIETQFRFYVSTNANKDLHAKSWKKGSMLPLTEDVIKMNEFIVKEEIKWSKKLNKDQNNTSYVRNLSEVLLAHVILLNRKRSGEAQRITIEDYLRKEDESGVQDIYQSLTATEKVLVKNIKRFIIRGKKGRSVPVIFTKDMQSHTEILLKSRTFVASSNPYLFANPGTENGFLYSYKVLKKIAMASNVANIEAITATYLRKHIATIVQLISMEDNDLEQLSNHLGHEKATHLNYYRKTDDKLQIAKVSKLLLLMEKKSMGEYRGKTLDNIDLEIPDLQDEEDYVSLNASGNINTINRKSINAAALSKNNREDKNKKIQFSENEPCLTRKEKDRSNTRIENDTKDSTKSDKNKTTRGVRIPWTSEQRKFAQIFFSKHLAYKKPPKRSEVEELKRLHPTTFQNKTWPQIKIFIVNEYKKNK